MKEQMKEFKKRLIVQTKRGTDEHILNRVVMTLEELEKKTDIQVYRNQICDRKEKIKQLFIDFDISMEIIKRQGSSYQKENNRITTLDMLDKILAKNIIHALDELYKEKNEQKQQINIGVNNDKGYILSLIIERQYYLAELLQDFDRKMKFIHIEQTQQKQIRDQKEEETLSFKQNVIR